ncbi:hypothetical protein [uncultured Gammaproteobacteria bacterium]|nr:hypothetical protein BROOK1789B_1060 [Bathymodiolus brooksi thiotrophic gill symbiont]CAC9558684.1 hypothetical protein [uncultured Gammaproteobacteria bacterium]
MSAIFLSVKKQQIELDRDLCINMNNHQKLNSANHPYLCKGL